MSEYVPPDHLDLLGEFEPHRVSLFRSRFQADQGRELPARWIVLRGYDSLTHAQWCLPVPEHIVSIYIDALRTVPHTVGLWSRDALRDVLEEVEMDDNCALQRALATFACHGGAWACSVLGDLMTQVPPDLQPFAEAAYAQGMARLGWNYTRLWPHKRGSLQPQRSQR